ncbi:MAG TPA: FAD-binding oxidoreductase [Pyrinomonadaceae bacterium]|nr:FAD-binding oxidoreductase [Pyrinomonadaceae bacterium]
MKRYESWGRYPHANHTRVITVRTADILPAVHQGESMLAFAQGRSYGDTCLNDGGILLDTSLLSGILSFDKERGVLRCEAGTTLAKILELIIQYGWFLPVAPGTKYVSVGGAIAHDVHGKNHHRAGTFGRYVKQFELLRSSGERLVCSSAQNPELFRATIAGMGLTGLITWAEFQLHPIEGPNIAVERLRFANLDEFYSLAASSDQDYEYTVAWLDAGSGGSNTGRGIFTRGNTTKTGTSQTRRTEILRLWRMPVDAPSFIFNRFTVKAMQALYYRTQSQLAAKEIVHYEPFLFPLDAIGNWNRIYGRRGFLQYQCVVPFDERQAIEEILSRINRSGLTAVLAVLKTFGNVKSPGMLSFPRPGVTLAVDFPNQGAGTLRLLDQLDEITRAARGAVYPAKDARMSAESFQTYFPEWKTFARYIDPKFSSSFWRRVSASSARN